MGGAKDGREVLVSGLNATTIPFALFRSSSSRLSTEFISQLALEQTRLIARSMSMIHDVF